MTQSATSTSLSVPRRILLVVAIGILFLAIAGVIYENISETRDRRFNPMTGQLVDVGGRKMHIDCAGQGMPVVIFESGLGDSFLSWRKVQPEVAKFTRTCSYDRAGIGYSETSSGPRTSRVFAEQLHALLQAASVSPPYILVGHSMGGYDVRLFASRFRGEVAGMVLVDASHPDQENRFPPELKAMEGSWLRDAEFVAYTMPFGLPRLMDLCDDDPVLRAAECNFQTAFENMAEIKSFPRSAAETAATGSLGDMPLAVLSHDPDRPSADLPPDVAKVTNDAWEKMQVELSHLSTRGTETIVKGSSHYIQIDRPEAVVAAIKNVYGQAIQAAAPKPN